MDTRVDISNEALLRLIKQIDARPDPARLGSVGSDVLVRRIRSVHPAATTRRSTFRLARKAPLKRALFRARIGADKEHLANISRALRT